MSLPYHRGKTDKKPPGDTARGPFFRPRGVLATVRPFNHQEADNDHKTDRSHRSNMVPNAGWMGAAAILSEMQGGMTLSF